jgi:hypothetical protein
MDQLYCLMKCIAECPQWMMYASIPIALTYGSIFGFINKDNMPKSNLEKISDEDKELIMTISGSAGGGV